MDRSVIAGGTVGMVTSPDGAEGTVQQPPAPVLHGHPQLAARVPTAGDHTTEMGRYAFEWPNENAENVNRG